MTARANGTARKQLSSTAVRSLVLVSILALAVAGCSGRGTNPTDLAPRRSPAVRVEATTVQRISVRRKVDLAGTLISPGQARVSSEVSGIVRNVLVELGQEVAPGEVVVELDPRELEFALRRAESQLRQTEAQLGMDGLLEKEPPPDEQIAAVRTATANRDDARAQLARATRLRGQGLLPQADLDTAQTRMKVMEAAHQATLENVQSLKASLQERRADFELAQKKLSDAVIRAPVAGQVSERLVQPGEFMRENTPVITIVQMNPLKLRTAVQERHASVIRPNLPVEFRVESFPEMVFKGTVAYLSPAVDQTTRTFAVEVLVDNADRRLKPGFFAKGVIYTQRDENVLAVPEDAVSTLAGVSTVYVIDNGTVHQQIVTLGAHQDNTFEILDGLKGTESLATTNLSQLATGVVVEIGSNSQADYPTQGGTYRRDQGERP